MTPLDDFEGVYFLPATENPFGVDVWDCSAFTQSRIAMTGDPAIAAGFVRRRASTGAEYREQAPDETSSVEVALRYGINRTLPEGPIFKAAEMEDKWDIYCFRPHIYFVRSWTGQLLHRAHIRSDPGTLTITRIDTGPGQTPEYDRRAVDYLMKSHVLGHVVPHPVPAALPRDPAQIAVFSFASFGRRCWYATYDDPTCFSKTR
jgi:hypothetical protein